MSESPIVILRLVLELLKFLKEYTQATGTDATKEEILKVQAEIKEAVEKWNE